MTCERLGRWRIKNGVIEGSKESLVWELQAWEMRSSENQARLQIVVQPLRKVLLNFAMQNSL